MSAIALVTGANKGIGYETALALGRLGMTVVLGIRDPQRAALALKQLTAAGVTARAIQLDVTDEQTVKAAAAFVETNFGRLDVLVNNAGVLVDAGVPVTEVSAGQMRETFDTNVFGVVAVTSAMVPLLRRSAAGRVVNLSSGLGSQRRNSEQHERLAAYQMLAYCSSKAALNSLTILYANALRADGIKVNAAEPGFVATDLNGHSGPGSAAEGAEIVVRLATLDETGPTGTFQSADGPIEW
jgi:NAD(P)-dependent dehydrogenase (short-subunit alcohol dehydrogenase family)